MHLAACRNLSLFNIFCLSFGLLFSTFARPAFAAKDLSHRFGIGASNIGPGRTPTLSLDWQASRATAFEFNLGVNTTATDNELMLGLRFSRNLYIEENQFYFLYVGGGLVSQQISGSNRSGYLFETGGGAKAFLSGLPNLGLSLRGGFELKSAGGVSFQSVVHFGFHYYF